MRAYVEQTTGNIWNNVNGLSKVLLQGTLGAQQLLELQFGNIDPVTGLFDPVLLDNPDGMIFGAKIARYDGSFAISCSAFTAPGDSTGFYTGILSFNTAALQTALGTGDDPDTIPNVTLIGEVDWIPNGSGSIAKSNPVALQVNNTVITGDEGATTPANPSFPPWSQVAPFLKSITGLTGGGASNLDGIVTAGSVAPDGVIIPNVRPAAVIWQQVLAAAIVSSSIAADTVIETATPHNLVAGQGFTIGGHAGSTPSLDGNGTVLAVIDSTHFTTAVDVTVAGAGGWVTPAAVAGAIVRPADFDSATNARTWQSVF